MYTRVYTKVENRVVHNVDHWSVFYTLINQTTKSSEKWIETGPVDKVHNASTTRVNKTKIVAMHGLSFFCLFYSIMDGLDLNEHTISLANRYFI